MYPRENGRMDPALLDCAHVQGGFDLEVSSDLIQWTRIGSFSPGNVSAFATDPHPPTGPNTARFYHAVQVIGP